MTSLDLNGLQRKIAPEAAKVSVVVATRDRPALLRRALRSILNQTGIDGLEVIVVFDQSPIDMLEDLAVGSNQTLLKMSNTRQAGLAGARNTGIYSSKHEYVAFCDDDDEWAPNRLSSQINAWREDPDAIGVSSSIVIESPGGTHIRTAGDRVSFEDFLESRITSVHTSTFLWRRDELLHLYGPIDEDLPAAYGEDYDLLLRASRFGHILSLPEPLVTVHWDRPSFFDARWQNIANGLTYLLRKHPELTGNAVGTARIASQVAFAHAALGDRRRAFWWARSALARDLRQWRSYAALLIALRVIRPGVLVTLVNRRGRGL